MPGNDFHDKPFDEGTRTKLQIFELYTKGWLPVFLSPEKPSHKAIHVFDFFSGPGTDSKQVPGSPLRLLQQLKGFEKLRGWNNVNIHVHFYDESDEKVTRLKENIQSYELNIPNVRYDIRSLRFEVAFNLCAPILSNPRAAKLILIDQTGVGQVTDEVFLRLVSSPACDFLFFISSSTLLRFRDHPAIKQRINRPDDYYQVHRAALQYYRSLLPKGKRYFLAPFSLKKGSNIYGIIFGSAHPLGIDKFLQVAWGKDEISGEADFDINRENIRTGEIPLFPEMRPSKITAFEAELERLLRNGSLSNELDVMQVCFDHGVKRQHAAPVLRKLKTEGVIQLDFRVPDIRHLDSPRKIIMSK